jgi:signal transduction histidine kinase
MKRLRLLIFSFCLALAIPLGYFIFCTYENLAQEESNELSFFAQTLFDRIEQELDLLINNEENRSVDDYSYYISENKKNNKNSSQDNERRSPLSSLSDKNFILGYIQNSPDGSFQTPLVKSIDQVPPEHKEIIAKLSKVNAIFNKKRLVSAKTSISSKIIVEKKADIQLKKKKSKSFASKYLKDSIGSKSRSRLGRKEKQVQEITVAQARNLAQFEMSNQEQEVDLNASMAQTEVRQSKKASRTAVLEESMTLPVEKNDSFVSNWTRRKKVTPQKKAERSLGLSSMAKENNKLEKIEQPQATYEIEIAPMQSLIINRDTIFVFRRIVLNNQVYRQGFIIKLKPFMQYLADKYFNNQPMSAFSNLLLEAVSQNNESISMSSGAAAYSPKISISRVFPRPFYFLKATVNCDKVPPSAGRQTLMVMVVIAAVVIILGTFGIYQSARVVLELSERRTGFVSSVTHELKTPLTNIKLYLEMLEQGIARDTEREQDYYQILNAEASRLSRLINNVLEFSKLEKKQRPLTLEPGNFNQVVSEVSGIMSQKLKQEGFIFKVEMSSKVFIYDHEAMVQILINLMENSMKFGKSSAEKIIRLKVYSKAEKNIILLSDTGPGIPDQAVKMIFDDFYRVDNSLTRNTKGCGIGLALVKRLVLAMNGKVSVFNNQGLGCTVKIEI